MHIGEFKQVIDHVRQTLVGGRLTRINAPAPGSVAMTFDLEVPEPVVIASVNPRCSTIFTTDTEPPFYESSKPQRMLNTSFVKALEHTCLGFTLTEAELLRPDDRIALLTFHHTDQYGEEKTRTLQIELTGRVAHMFLLTETGRVVSSMRRLHRPGTREFKEAKRRIAAGKPLPPPPKPPTGHEEAPPAPLEEVMMCEKDAFAKLQNEIAGPSRSSEPEAENRQAEALRADPTVMGAVEGKKNSEQCKRWYQMGENYRKNGAKDLALTYYEKVVKLLPDSDLGRIAQRRINELKR